MLDQLHNFLTLGYAKFQDPGILDLEQFDIPNVEFFSDPVLGEFEGKELEEITAFQNYILKKYVLLVYPNAKIKYCAVWDGVDSGSMNWHNDAVEGFDFNMLYYFDDCDEVSGGQIEFMHPEGTVTLYPKHGDIVFINQDSKFKHRAFRSKGNRRVASMEFTI
jgi:hypothetical protein